MLAGILSVSIDYRSSSRPVRDSASKLKVYLRTSKADLPTHLYVHIRKCQREGERGRERELKNFQEK